MTIGGVIFGLFMFPAMRFDGDVDVGWLGSLVSAALTGTFWGVAMYFYLKSKADDTSR